MTMDITERNKNLLESVDARTRLAGSNKMEILLFSLGTRETFGINVFKVREVGRTPHITRTPNMPRGVEGLISLRGNVIPVLSLSSFLQLDGTPPGLGKSMMVAEYSKRTLGFLVHEVDRFRAIGMPDFGNENDVKAALKGLEPSLQPRWHKGPITVGIRIPNTREERQSVLFESIFGGRDYSQRPEFYIPYDEVEKERVLRRARPAKNFAAHYPKQSADLQEILKKTHRTIFSRNRIKSAISLCNRSIRLYSLI